MFWLEEMTEMAMLPASRNWKKSADWAHRFSNFYKFYYPQAK